MIKTTLEKLISSKHKYFSFHNTTKELPAENILLPLLSYNFY